MTMDDKSKINWILQQWRISCHNAQFCILLYNVKLSNPTKKNTRTAESIKENVGFLPKIVAKTQKY
jgi:hypothetical protein